MSIRAAEGKHMKQKNYPKTGHRMLEKEQEEPKVYEFGLSQGSQPLQVTSNNLHGEVIELPLDANKRPRPQKWLT